MATGMKVTFKGPLFRASTRAAVLDGENGMRRRILKSITDAAFKSVMGILQARIVHPTPYYWTQIRIDRTYIDRWRVHDDGHIVYNHWLEGDGSRNYPVTRFKGYHAWQLTYDRIAPRAGKLAQTQVGRTVRRLGGNVTVAGEAE